MDIQTVLDENTAMRRALRERHAKENGISRKAHSGYILQSKRIADTRIRLGTKDVRNAFIADYETCYSADTMPVLALKPHIEEDLAQLAANAEYEGSDPPRLLETRLSVPRGAANWVVTGIFNKEFATAKGGENDA